MRHHGGRILALGLFLTATASLGHANPSIFGYPGLNDKVCALAEYNGDLIAGGHFSLAGGSPVGRIARWDGSSWHALAEGVDGQRMYADTRGDTIVFDPHVLALAVYDGDLIAGGSFTTAGGQEAHSVARWDGSDWYPLGPGMSQSIIIYEAAQYYTFPPLVTTLAVFDGDLVAGGIFRKVGETTTNFVSRWDGATWSPLNSGLIGGMPPRLLSLKASGNTLFAGGDFQAADYEFCGRIARWNGSQWQIYDSIGMNQEINALTTHEGRVVAAGRFTYAGSTPVQHLARWNGSGWESMGDGIPNEVRCFARYQGDLFAGAFRWNGSNWINELLTNGAIHTLLVYRGSLVAGGEFTVFDGRACWNIAAWPDDSNVGNFLESFTAERQRRSAILRWALAHSDYGLRFDVYRQEPGRERVRINDLPVAGASPFQFSDATAPAGEVEYWLRLADVLYRPGPWLGSTSLAGAETVLPELLLAPNHPNPFNPRTNFTYHLDRTGWVRLTIYDARGQSIAVLVDNFLPAGEHTTHWLGNHDTGQEAASGVYFALLETDTGRHTRKITLAR